MDLQEKNKNPSLQELHKLKMEWAFAYTNSGFSLMYQLSYLLAIALCIWEILKYFIAYFIHSRRRDMVKEKKAE